MNALAISQSHLDAVAAVGGCSPGSLDNYDAGMPIANVLHDDLIWCARNLPAEMIAQAEEAAGLPLWALAGSGYGDGFSTETDGGGYGKSDGFGSGCSSGTNGSLGGAGGIYDDRYGYGYESSLGSGVGVCKPLYHDTRAGETDIYCDAP